MKKVIVGSEAKYWTKAQEAFVRNMIAMMLQPGDTVVTGECPFGGIDLWAKEVAYSKGNGVMLFPPVKKSWYWYKKRNIQMAVEGDIVFCIEPRDRKSGGYWTLTYARKLGKPGILIEVDI